MNTGTAGCVVVTGGGHGLGRAAALALGAQDRHVVVVDVARADEVVAEIVGAGGRASAVEASVADPAGVADLAAAAARAGGCQALLHAAGIVRRTPLPDVDHELLVRTVEVNLVGSVLTCQALLPQLRAAAHGRVVLLGSGAGLFGLSGQVVYGATKAGQVGIVRNLAHETRNDDVAVNAVLPYAVTNPGRTRLEWDADDLDLVGRRATPAHVVPLLEHLLSPACRVSGRIYSAFGGRYARVVSAVGTGWLAPDHAAPSAADVAAHFTAIDDVHDVWVPETFEAELTEVARRIRDLG